MPDAGVAEERVPRTRRMQPPRRLALLEEASAIAGASQAHRIVRQVNEARAELSDQHTHRPA
jgi:hypothetical protein